MLKFLDKLLIIDFDFSLIQEIFLSTFVDLTDDDTAFNMHCKADIDEGSYNGILLKFKMIFISTFIHMLI